MLQVVVDKHPEVCDASAMSMQNFINPVRGLGELSAQRLLFWRVFAVTILVYLCL